MSRTIDRTTYNWTKKDTLNLMSAFTLQELCDSGDWVTVDKCALITRTDDGSDPVKSFALHTIDGQYFVGISSTAYEQVRDIIDYVEDLEADPNAEINENDLISVRAVRKKSKAGRDFIVLDIA